VGVEVLTEALIMTQVSGIRCHVNWYVVTNVSEENVSSSCRVHATQDYLPTDMVSYLRRLESEYPVPSLVSLE
jgi:hypothetical protein